MSKFKKEGFSEAQYFKLTPTANKRLKELAAREGVSVPAILRHFLDEGLQRHPKPE